MGRDKMRAATLLLSGLMSMPVMAASETIECPVYVNAVAAARQMGLTTAKGLGHVNEFVQYALGFYTGYTSVADNVWDILAEIRGDNMHIAIITMLYPYCQSYPTDDFDNALFDTIYQLLPKAQIGKPAN